MKNIKQLIAFKSAPVEIDAKRIQANRLKASLLFSSSDKSWEMKGMINLNPMFIRPPGADTPMKSLPMAYIVEGNFPSYFSGKPVPEKPAEQPATPSPETKDPSSSAAPTPAGLERKGDVIPLSKPAKIFIIGSPEMLTDNLIGEQADNPNATFIMNIIDVLNNREDIAMMRGKVQSFNPLIVKDEQVKILVKGFNIVGLPMLVIAAGLIIWVRRTSRKRRIEAIFREQGSTS
jgi:ABC-2 type transport system permease protein